jgi:hypothetical protein
VLQAFKNVPRQKFIDYMPSEEELDIIATIHENIPSVVAKDYLDSNSLTIINNKQRLNKWAKNRIDKYDYDTEKLRAEIEELRKRKSESEYQLEKDEIQIKIDRQEENIRKRTIEFHDYKSKVELEIEEQISEFERQFIVEGFVYPNMVIKF